MVSRTCLTLGITRRSLINQKSFSLRTVSIPVAALASLVMKGSVRYPSFIAVRRLVSSSSFDDVDLACEEPKMEAIVCVGESGSQEGASAAQFSSPGM